ncbi:MAG: helix-turn-helix transcriptional regulator [Oscillospiraceae bacterium]|nr:helix-turn-helix transcriptional regulator [Oscillospiraceae bacterium]
MRDIGKNIRQLRLRKNMTQDELAERLFVTRQTVSNYETGKSRPDVEMLVKIGEELGTDIQQLIYGPEPKRLKQEAFRLIIGTGLTVLTGILWLVLSPIAQERRSISYELGLMFTVYFVIRPLFFLLSGWTLCQLEGMALGKKPLRGKWSRRIGAVMLVLAALWFGLMIWYHTAVMVNEWQYDQHIRGEWVQSQIEYDGEISTAMSWSMLPPQVPAWLEWVTSKPTFYMLRYPAANILLTVLYGGMLWVLGVPSPGKKNPES